MTTYGVTATGFARKHLTEIVADLESRLKDAFGVDIRLDSKSVFGKLVGCFAEPLAEVWELAEAVYSSHNPLTSAGAQLDGALALVGITRRPAVKSTVSECVGGSVGVTIPESSQIAVEDDGSIFLTLDAVTIDASVAVGAIVTVPTPTVGWIYTVTINGHDYSHTAAGGEDAGDVAAAIQGEIVAGVDPVSAIASDALIGIGGDADVVTGLPTAFTIAVSNVALTRVDNLVDCEAQESGEVRAPATTLTEIRTPVLNWTYASNPLDATVGEEEETDAAARARRAESLFKPGKTSPDAIRARLLELTNVERCTVLQNITDTTDSDGLLPHSIHAVVTGGDEAEIADCLWANVGAGIYTNGDITRQVLDSEGQVQSVRFSRPDAVLLWVRVTYTLYAEEQFPAAGESLILSAVLDYGNSLDPGEDVMPQRFVGPIFDECAGIATVLVEVALDSGGSPGAYRSTPYAIGRLAEAQFDTGRVQIVGP